MCEDVRDWNVNIDVNSLEIIVCCMWPYGWVGRYLFVASHIGQLWYLLCLIWKLYHCGISIHATKILLFKKRKIACALCFHVMSYRSGLSWNWRFLFLFVCVATITCQAKLSLYSYLLMTQHNLVIHFTQFMWCVFSITQHFKIFFLLNLAYDATEKNSLFYIFCRIK